jgi:HEAT repeat protein
MLHVQSSENESKLVSQLLNDREAVPVLVSLLENKKLCVRWRAAEALLRMKVRSPAEVIAILNDAVGNLAAYDDRYQVAEILEQMGPSAAPASSGLVRALGDLGPDWSNDSDTEPLCEKVARILVRIGPPAVPVLKAGLEAEDPWARRRAALALSKISPESTEGVSILIDALKDDFARRMIGKEVLKALARIGPRARSAVPQLLSINEEGLRSETRNTLLKIDPEAAGKDAK